mmetsp:Transcript_2261/g.5271  ORF Transcript_2261/g.5271 Transcript_2261/m.5271 type:complete len:220 (-) Transcript_2261:670-1329(-)
MSYLLATLVDLNGFATLLLIAMTDLRNEATLLLLQAGPHCGLVSLPVIDFVSPHHRFFNSSGHQSDGFCRSEATDGCSVPVSSSDWHNRYRRGGIICPAVSFLLRRQRFDHVLDVDLISGDIGADALLIILIRAAGAVDHGGNGLTGPSLVRVLHCILRDVDHLLAPHLLNLHGLPKFGHTPKAAVKALSDVGDHHKGMKSFISQGLHEGRVHEIKSFA